jgi:hypothetical protein
LEHGSYIFISFAAAMCANTMHAQTNVTISGMLRTASHGEAAAFVSIILRKAADSAIIAAAIANEHGRFTLTGIKSGNYLVQASLTGMQTKTMPLYVGSLSLFWT